jgi:hypothetical protein
MPGERTRRIVAVRKLNLDLRAGQLFCFSGATYSNPPAAAQLDGSMADLFNFVVGHSSGNCGQRREVPMAAIASMMTRFSFLFDDGREPLQLELMLGGGHKMNRSVFGAADFSVTQPWPALGLSSIADKGGGDATSEPDRNRPPRHMASWPESIPQKHPRTRDSDRK